MKWDLNEKRYRICQIKEWWETEWQKNDCRTHRKGNVICLSAKVTCTKYPHVLPYRKHGFSETGKNSLAPKI